MIYYHIFYFKVNLIVNSRPALNDVTYFEMQVIMEKLQKSNSEIESFVKEGKIKILENGSGSPCINLMSVSHYFMGQ